jgi:hypothetical protein
MVFVTLRAKGHDSVVLALERVAAIAAHNTSHHALHALTEASRYASDPCGAVVMTDSNWWRDALSVTLLDVLQSESYPERNAKSRVPVGENQYLMALAIYTPRVEIVIFT